MTKRFLTPFMAWTPFFDPLNIFHDWGVLLAIPLALLISMAYKAMRVGQYRSYWRHVLVMTLQILLGMIAMLLALYVLVEWVIPRL